MNHTFISFVAFAISLCLLTTLNAQVRHGFMGGAYLSNSVSEFAETHEGVGIGFDFTYTYFSYINDQTKASLDLGLGRAKFDPTQEIFEYTDFEGDLNRIRYSDYGFLSYSMGLSIYREIINRVELFGGFDVGQVSVKWSELDYLTGPVEPFDGYYSSDYKAGFGYLAGKAGLNVLVADNIGLGYAFKYRVNYGVERFWGLTKNYITNGMHIFFRF